MNQTEPQPKFSVVTVVHEQSSGVTAALAPILAQTCDAYEVIVVNENPSAEMLDELNALRQRHHNLYTTFLPHYQFQKNRRRLAFSLGSRASRGEWHVYADIDGATPPADWLEGLLPGCDGDNVLQLGYADRKTGRVRWDAYFDVSQAARHIIRAERWRAGVGRDAWQRRFRPLTRYDYMAVTAEYAPALLQIMAQDPKTVFAKK